MIKFKNFIREVTHGSEEGDKIEYFNIKAMVER